jgi:hypothetical protein
VGGMEKAPAPHELTCAQWVRDIIRGVGGFHDFEHYEKAVFGAGSPEDRDEGLACFLIRVLANPAHASSAEVLKAIHEKRGDAQDPPRPWHYVTEKLPEPRERVRFWRYWPGSNLPVLSGAGKYICTKEGHPWFGAWPTPDRAAFSPDGSVVYAWEAEPEPPPLPVDPDLLQALKDAARMERKR